MRGGAAAGTAPGHPGKRDGAPANNVGEEQDGLMTRVARRLGIQAPADNAQDLSGGN